MDAREVRKVTAKYDWQAIKDQYPIAETIGNHVQLKKRGNEYHGLCPFHNEKTPSFQVIPDKNFFHCQGCGESGDVIDFIAKYENTTTQEAIIRLTGGSLIEQSPELKEKRKKQAAKREIDDAAREAAAIAKAQRGWENAQPANASHPYLVRKGVSPYTLRQTDDGRLVLPVYGADGEVQSLQTISADGDKKFLSDAPMANGRMYVGINMGRTILCEGYATGASIYDAIPDQVCVTYSLGNMEKVARSMVEDGRQIMLAPDTGLATEKMLALGAELGVPVIPPPSDIEVADPHTGEVKPGTDYNDMAQSLGIEAVEAHFVAVLKSLDDAAKSDAGPCEIEAGDITAIDLQSPPGFSGELTRYIEGRNFRSRRDLAVACALMAIANIAGLYYEDDISGMTTNLMVFCVAGSGSGKDGPLSCLGEVHRIAGMAPAAHGSFKSEQEIYRNLIRHQAAFYVLDELGQSLMKVKNAQKRGGAAYLEGFIGLAISAFTKTNDFLGISGDAKDEVKKALVGELAQINRANDDDGETPWRTAKAASLERALGNIDNGLEKPFLSMIGFSEPASFNAIVDREWATNGFFRRALIFNEHETAPRRKEFSREEMPLHMQMRIKQIARVEDGDSDMPLVRIENYGKRKVVTTTPDARKALEEIAIWFDDEAIRQKETGLESLFLGGEVMVSKISLTLAIADGEERTLEHVRWAFAMARRDLRQKMNMVIGNDTDKHSKDDALTARILSIVGVDDEREGVIVNRVSRLNGVDKETVIGALRFMTGKGALVRTEKRHPVNGSISYRYRAP